MAQASDFEGRGRGKLSLAGGFQAEPSRHITTAGCEFHPGKNSYCVILAHEPAGSPEA